MQIITNPNEVEIKQWADFVSSHPNGNIFQSAEFYNVCQSTNNLKPIIVIYKENDSILGVLLAVIHKENKGILGYLSSRSIIMGGPLLLGNDNKVLDSLLTNYKRIIGRKVIFSQFRNFTDQNLNKEIFAKHGYKFDEHLNIIINLESGSDYLWKNFSRSRKKGIKKAKNLDLSFNTSNSKSNIDKFYELLSISYNRIKLPFPKIDHFYSIVEKLNNNNYKIFNLTYNNKTIVSMLGLIYNKTLYGYYMGLTDNRDLLKNKPTDLFFWEVFNWSIDNELIIYDWMGAGKPNKSYGVRDFKMQFGGELVNLGRFEKIHKPILFLIGKFGLKILQKFKR